MVIISSIISNPDGENVLKICEVTLNIDTNAHCKNGYYWAILKILLFLKIPEIGQIFAL